MSMLPQLHRHAWMDEEIEAFRVQARRYIEREMVPAGAARALFRAKSGAPSENSVF
jgi:hypothetical protein